MFIGVMVDLQFKRNFDGDVVIGRVEKLKLVVVIDLQLNKKVIGDDVVVKQRSLVMGIEYVILFWRFFRFFYWKLGILENVFCK